MIQLYQRLPFLIIASFIVASLAGGWYVLNTFKHVKEGLPVESLKLHRNLSGQIQTIFVLTEKLGQAQGDPRQVNLDELTVALDAAFVAKNTLNINLLSAEYQKYGFVENEINTLLISIEELLDSALPFDPVRASLLHTRFTYILAQFQNSYLAVNEQTLSSLTNQSHALDQLRSNTLLLLSIIGAAIVIMFVLLVRLSRFTTRLHTARNDLALQTNMLQTTLEAIDQGFAVWDSEDRLVLWNSSCLDFWYHPKTVFVGLKRIDLLRHLAEENAFGEGDRGKLAAQQMLKIQDMGSEAVEHLQLRDGRHLLLRRYPMPDNGTATVYTDITERKKVEKKLKESHDTLEKKVEERTREFMQAKEEAEYSNRTKSSILANMSHELRTPLNAVIGFSEMIQGEVLGPLGNDSYKSYIDLINQSGNHLLSLINDILDVSRIDAGVEELDEVDIDVAKSVIEISRMSLRRAQEKGIELDVKIASDLPHIHVDRRRLFQILLNLLDNAIKFTEPKGQVIISAALSKAGGMEFQVSDTGIGIAPEFIPEVLKPFGQVAEVMMRSQGGSGLGLPLTVSLVELHGGTLNIDSKVGKGTVVTFCFPPERTVRK